MGKASEEDSPQSPVSEADRRRARLAAELRENLRRRKAQAKARSAAGEGVQAQVTAGGGCKSVAEARGGPEDRPPEN